MSVAATPQTTQKTILLKRRQVLERLGVSHVTIWRLQRLGQFPPPIRISPGRVAWREADIEQWIADRARAANDRASQGA
jgi:prophage regulatory protein